MITTKQILQGWNYRRILFLIISLVYLVTSIVDFMWIGVIFSLFLVSQAVLGIGCAGGNCNIKTD